MKLQSLSTPDEQWIKKFLQLSLLLPSRYLPLIDCLFFFPEVVSIDIFIATSQPKCLPCLKRKRLLLTKILKGFISEVFSYFCRQIKAHNICATRVFLLSLFSYNFNDQLSPKFHRFVIVHICWDTPSMRILVLASTWRSTWRWSLTITKGVRCLKASGDIVNHSICRILLNEVIRWSFWYQPEHIGPPKQSPDPVDTAP